MPKLARVPRRRALGSGVVSGHADGGVARGRDWRLRIMAKLRITAKWRRVGRAVAVAGMISLALTLASLGSARAQGADVQDLIAHIQRLGQDLAELQKEVYSGTGRPAPARAAPVSQAAQTSVPRIARLQVRLTEFENQLRNLTGRVEEFGFKINQTHDRLNKLVEDVDFRLSALERDIATAPGETAWGSAPPQEDAAPALPERPGPAPAAGVLGVISAADLASGTRRAPEEPRKPKMFLPAGTPAEQYNFAFRLLRQTDYGDAEIAFHEFIATHPEHRLAANAQYWLGETFYVRKDFGQAAEAFLVGYQKFPDSPKAPDNLLKLGMSLAAMGVAEEACKSLVELLGNYPNAPGRIRDNAERQRRLIGCS